MKKQLVIAGLATMMLAGTASATIVGTKHDLSSGGGFGDGTIIEVCVYCHTPHGSNTSFTGPLWNASKSVANIATVYGDPSGTIDATLTTSGIESADAMLCLTCHDGNLASRTLVNMPNSGGTVNTQAMTNNLAELGVDFTNDHPVGFNYDEAAAADAGIATASGTGGAFVLASDNLPLFGANNSMMWCSTCHNVHDNTNAPFLRTTIEDSYLCTRCHSNK